MFIAVVQFNPTVGALRQNCTRALAHLDELAALPYPPDLVVFPAFALTGAELGGLVAHNAFAAECLDVAQHFMSKAALPTLIGTVLPRPAMGNTRFVCEEEVLFAMGGKGSALGFLDLTSNAEAQDYVESVQIKMGGSKLAVVLDDFIDPEANYDDCDAIISLIARPYQDTNGLLTASSQIDSLRADALANDCWVVVANLCGGEDAFVYEGGSIVLGPDGAVVDSAPPFEEAVLTVNLSSTEGADAADTGRGAVDTSQVRLRDRKRILPLLPYEATWRALALGVGDYVRKNGFEGVVLGLSGGIDSALTAALAVDALGAPAVHGVLMPSPHSSEGSLVDAQALASNLGIDTITYPISELFASFTAQSEALLGTPGSALAVQNLQARIRTLILMHLSNTKGWLLLNTGNKSEAAMGYSTLYGDTAGALAPLGNIYKTDVYGLANWRNSRGAVLPQEIIDKEPSAELYPGQKDVDTLPPYEELDQILRLHIEESLGVDEILEFLSTDPINTVITTKTILDVLNKVSRSEYKRRQEPMAFQFDAVDMTLHRAWPLTNGFADHSRDIVAPAEIINYLGHMYREAGSDGFDFLEH